MLIKKNVNFLKWFAPNTIMYVTLAVPKKKNHKKFFPKLNPKYPQFIVRNTTEDKLINSGNG